ncbi:MAG: hypothetical protein R3B81_09910 [bacterium]
MTFCRPTPFLRTIAALTSFVFLTTTLDLFVAATAHAASDRESLEEAQDYFLVADFGTALDRVDKLLGSGHLEGGVLRDAWVLKARCEIGLAHRSSAVDAYCQALRVDPTWRPDQDLFTKDEIDVFDQARSGCDLERTEAPSPLPAPAASGGGGTPWYKNKTVLIVAGVLVVGGAVALLAGGSDEPELPGPPPPPPATN